MKNKDLSAELRLKDKASTEVAALLILKKRLQPIGSRRGE